MLLFVPPLTSLFFFSGFAVAGLVAPDCTATDFQWVRILSFLHSIHWLLTDLVAFPQSSNSLGQNACTIAAYMFSTCHGGCKLFPRLFCLVLAPAVNLIVSSLFQR